MKNLTDEKIIFNSRDEKYKYPFGAVPQGTEVNFSFEASLAYLKEAKLVIMKQLIEGDRKKIDFIDEEKIIMNKISSENQELWKGKYSFSDKGVYVYYFELLTKENEELYLSSKGEYIKVEHYNLPLTGGLGVVHKKMLEESHFVQTVYDPEFKTPQWAKDTVYYYIFPDRFRNGDRKNDPRLGKKLFYGNKDVEFHENWNDEKPWVPGDGKSDNEYCNDFYGGDLQGIIEKLDYLKDLGINCIYMTPIFEAPSNHKYDTADYMKIDSSFGTVEDFKRLTAEAKERGIRVILDVSINHSGSDSVYMDRYAKYEGLGAFENDILRKESPYYDWYLFNEEAKTADEKYEQWANPTLATLNPNSESFRDFAFRNEDSVMKYWLNQGSSGWRMDVAPWKPDDFWREWRKSVKETNPEAITVCETWWDSSKYFLGDTFDSTMNYIFRATLFEYAKGNYSGEKANDILEMMRENYPQEAFYALMNLLSTHDSPRALWHFGYTERSDKDHYEKAVAKLKLSLLFQMTYPGAPAIFYGDEVGITGGHDPYNRGPYPWADMGGSPDEKLLMETTKLIKLRNENPILRRGAIETLYSDENVIVYLREYEGKKAIIAINNSEEIREISLNVNFSGIFINLLDKEELKIENTKKVSIAPLWGKVYLEK